MEMVKKNPSVPVEEAARLSGLSKHMLTYLGRTEILPPSGSEPRRGRRRAYTFSDVIFLRVIAELLEKGIEVKRLREALKRARDETSSWIDIRRNPRRYLVTDGTELYVNRKGRLESKTVNGQFAFAFVIDLGPTHKAIADSWPRETRANRSRFAKS